MLWQFLVAHPLLTIALIGAITLWVVTAIDDKRDWDNYYKDKDWRKR